MPTGTKKIHEKVRKKKSLYFMDFLYAKNIFSILKNGNETCYIDRQKEKIPDE